MREIFQKMTPFRRHIYKENIEWLLNNYLKIRPDEKEENLIRWQNDLEILNDVIAKKL